MHNVKRIPYNLPNVVKSEIIYWVEGEKDVDNLNKIGLTPLSTIYIMCIYEVYLNIYLLSIFF